MNKKSLLLIAATLLILSACKSSSTSQKQPPKPTTPVNTPQTAIPVPADGQMKLGVWYTLSGPFVPVTNNPSSTNK